MKTDTLSDLKGTAMKNIVSLNLLRQIIFPLPPLDEQNRIVAKVNLLMALCHELEARQQQEQECCLRLGTASLTRLQNTESPEEFRQEWAQICDSFELIIDCPENISLLRQTILQLAVRGELKTNNPAESPILLYESKKQKLKPTFQNGDPNKIQIMDIFTKESYPINSKKQF